MKGEVCQPLTAEEGFFSFFKYIFYKIIKTMKYNPELLYSQILGSPYQSSIISRRHMDKKEVLGLCYSFPMFSVVVNAW